jgi:hypothetical protein
MKNDADWLHSLSVQADMVEILHDLGCNLNVLLPFRLESHLGYRDIFVSFLTMWEHYINFPALKEKSETNADEMKKFNQALNYHSKYKSMGAVTTPWSVIVPFSDSLRGLSKEYQTEESWQEYETIVKNNRLAKQVEQWKNAQGQPGSVLPHTHLHRHMDVYDTVSKRMGSVVDAINEDNVYKVSFPDEIEPVSVFFTDLRAVLVPVGARVHITRVESDNFDKYGYVSAVNDESEHPYTVTLFTGHVLNNICREHFCYHSIPMHSYVVVNQSDMNTLHTKLSLSKTIM